MRLSSCGLAVGLFLTIIIAAATSSESDHDLVCANSNSVEQVWIDHLQICKAGDHSTMKPIAPLTDPGNGIPTIGPKGPIPEQLQEGDPRLMQNVGIQEPSNAFSKDASDGPHDAASSGIVGPLGAGPSGYFITHDGSIVPRSERANSMAKWVEWLLRTEPLVLEHDQSSTSSPSLENIMHALGAKGHSDGRFWEMNLGVIGRHNISTRTIAHYANWIINSLGGKAGKGNTLWKRNFGRECFMNFSRDNKNSVGLMSGWLVAFALEDAIYCRAMHALEAVAKSALKAGFAYGKTEIYVRTVKAMSYNEERHWQCAFELVNE